MICIYCGRGCKNANSKRNHERLCHQNPNRQDLSGLQPRKGQHNPEWSHPSWNKGLTKDTNEILRRDSENKKGRPKGPKSDEYKQRQSEILKQSYRDGKNVGGLRKGAGRGKKGYYKGIWCDSTWELAYVVWNIDHSIPIERNKKSLHYSFEERILRYYPDFIVEGSRLIEIKGYMDAKAKIKAATYPEIEIITYGSIEKYLDYAKQKANSSDLTVLYEASMV